MLRIYNSLSKQKEIFKPIDPQRVRLYVCGMTVYDYCHIGHARVLVAFDVVYRYLCELYGKQHVVYVRNITDIDDKIINRAKENSESIDSLAQRYIDEMHKDSDMLDVLRPSSEPRATHHIEAIINMTQRLLKNGAAYRADNNDIYFNVSQFAQYGQLSGRNLDDERVGTRIGINENKHDPLDFVVWKAAKTGEPAWHSPWGPGRPGWAIECSAMSTCCLGNHFDIHGGGMDLKFPHHENEIAQSEAANGEKFVNYWMHNGYVTIDDTKMSKSLGNFVTVRDILNDYSPEVLRYFILTSHYRGPLSFTLPNLDTAKKALDRLYTALRDVPIIAESKSGNTADSYKVKFFAALDDDFNTPEAIAVLFEIVRDLNIAKSAGDIKKSESLGAAMRQLGHILGVLQNDVERSLKGMYIDKSSLSGKHIEQLIQERLTARKEMHWKRADEIRDQLMQHGIILEDNPLGTTWRRA
ncbi:MAG: cysteine--tRNA ligase [Pseudomonadota bacterium]